MTLSETIVGKQIFKELKWQDILILTMLMFGRAIWQSILMWISLEDQAISTHIEFSAADNIEALKSQVLMLLLAMGYLRLRNFDFSQWKAKITLMATAHGILLFVVAALVLDVYFIMIENLFVSPTPSEMMADISFVNPMLAQINYTTILFAVLNGVYEEIYFLGMCLCVSPKKVKHVFLFSFLIRISFHTYQGIVPAIGLGFLGIVYYIAYEKSSRRNLYPFFLSHAIADVVGLGILGYFY